MFVKQNGAHELFMTTYVVVGQRYYYIDFCLGGGGGVENISDYVIDLSNIFKLYHSEFLLSYNCM